MILTIHNDAYVDRIAKLPQKCGFTKIWEYTCSSYGIIYMQCTKKNYQFVQIYSLVSLLQ